MHADEIRKHQVTLKLGIEGLIKAFQAETGCTPQIEVDYDMIHRISGETQGIPKVTVFSLIR